MRAPLLATALLAAALALPAAAPANTVTPSCALPSLQQVSCGSWHAAAVTLRWSWDPFGTQTMTSGCDTRTFASDTPPAGARVDCTVHWGPAFAGNEATVRVDTTPPAITSATPARAPDHAGWYRHPVAFSFHGSDASSGVASCDTVTYSGPDGAGAGVLGGCTDAAGNHGVASFPLEYDSTPPAPARVGHVPGNHTIKLTWVAPPDAAGVRVVRLGSSGPARKLIYRGTAGHVRDRGLRNGMRYRYSVIVFDQAGNSTRTHVTAIPTASSLRPVSGSVVGAPPRLTWKPARHASYYNVQLLRGRRKIWSAWPRGAHLQLPRRWEYRGRMRHLVPGTYRWYVWPGHGSRDARRYGARIGGSAFHLRG